MTDYNVNFTDANIEPITVSEDTVVRDVVDVTLFGRISQNYGEEVNESLLNILENFSCPESPDTTTDFDATPDLTKVSKLQLHHPTDGQFWYNSSRETIYFFDGTAWIPVPSRGTYAANWGQVMHGSQLPKPTNQKGHTFEYDECIWSVSPANINGMIDSLNCNTDAYANVTMQYRYANTEGFVNGIANYLIIGITGNANAGVVIPPIVPAVTPTPTASSTPVATATPTPSVTPTLTAQATPTPTPTVTISRTRTPVPSSTPAVSVSATPAATPPPSATRTPAPITYCYNVPTFCMGYGDSGIQWTPLRQDANTTNPAPGYCAPANSRSNSCSGRIQRVNVNMANTHPSIRFVVNVSASNGTSTGNVEVFVRMNTVASNSAAETHTVPFVVNGVTHTLVVNANWYKSDGNNNAAIGTLSANWSFNTGIGACS